MGAYPTVQQREGYVLQIRRKNRVGAQGDFYGKYGKYNGVVYSDADMGAARPGAVAVYEKRMRHCPLRCRLYSVCGIAAVLEAVPCFSGCRRGRILSGRDFSQKTGKIVGKARGSYVFTGYHVRRWQLLAGGAGVPAHGGYGVMVSKTG